MCLTKKPFKIEALFIFGRNTGRSWDSGLPFSSKLICQYPQIIAKRFKFAPDTTCSIFDAVYCLRFSVPKRFQVQSVKNFCSIYRIYLIAPRYSIGWRFIKGQHIGCFPRLTSRDKLIPLPVHPVKKPTRCRGTEVNKLRYLLS